MVEAGVNEDETNVDTITTVVQHMKTHCQNESVVSQQLQEHSMWIRAGGNMEILKNRI